VGRTSFQEVSCSSNDLNIDNELKLEKKVLNTYIFHDPFLKCFFCDVKFLKMNEVFI